MIPLSLILWVLSLPITNNTTSELHTYLVESSKPSWGEAVDVAAIKEPMASTCYWVGGYRWTCQDKSRILLTDESGQRHCVKFKQD